MKLSDFKNNKSALIILLTLERINDKEDCSYIRENNNGYIRISLDLLGRLTGMSKTTIVKGIKTLEESWMIEKRKSNYGAASEFKVLKTHKDIKLSIIDFDNKESCKRYLSYEVNDKEFSI